MDSCWVSYVLLFFLSDVGILIVGDMNIFEVNFGFLKEDLVFL